MEKATDALVKESLDIKDAVKNGAYNVDYALIYDQIKLAALLALNPTTPEEAQDKFNIVSINLSTSLGERKDLDLFFHNDDDVNGELGLTTFLDDVTKRQKPLMIVINDHSHFVNVALTSNDEGKISVKYMNGMVPGDGINKDLPEVGKEFANKLHAYLKKTGVTLAAEGIEDISRDQQVGEACGLTVASNISAIVQNQELFSPKSAQEKREHYQALGMQLASFVGVENARMSAPAAPAPQSLTPAPVASSTPMPAAAPSPQVDITPARSVAEAPTHPIPPAAQLDGTTPAPFTPVASQDPQPAPASTTSADDEEEKKRRAAAAERSNLYSNKDLRNVIDAYEEKRRNALEARNINVPPEQRVREYLYANRAAVGAEVLNEITQINKSEHKDMQKKGDYKPIIFNKATPSPWQIKDPSGGVLHELTYKPEGNLIMAAVPAKATKGPLHISLALQDANGDNIDADKALFFDISYDDGGKVASISHPEPLKFVGTHPDEKCMFEVEGKPYFLKINKKTLDDLHKQLEQNCKEDKELDKPAGIVITIPDPTPAPALDTVSLPQPLSSPATIPTPSAPKPADRTPSAEDNKAPAPVLRPVTVPKPTAKSQSEDMMSELKRKQGDMQASIKARIDEGTYYTQAEPVAAMPQVDETAVADKAAEAPVPAKEREGLDTAVEAKPGEVIGTKRSEVPAPQLVRRMPLYVTPSSKPLDDKQFSGDIMKDSSAHIQSIREQIARNKAQTAAKKEAEEPAEIKKSVAGSRAVAAAKPPQAKDAGVKVTPKPKVEPPSLLGRGFNPHTMKATASVETPPKPISPMPGGNQHRANDGVSRKP